MKILICDDDKKYIDDVIEHLNFFSMKNNIDFQYYICLSAEEALKKNIKFDIAILDVEMENINGIKLGEYLRKINPHIILIYITAYKKYLDDALNLNAVRFFEKPIDSQRFYRGLEDSLKRIDNTTIKFYLKNGNVTERINAQDIIFAEIENRNSRVITANKEYHSKHHINFWRDSLKSSVFISPHKSFVINFNYITAYERDKIMLAGKYQIPIARSRQTEFYRKFMHFMEGK